MIKPICAMCNKELKQFGAILFSPPLTNKNRFVVKYHICINCYKKLRSSLNDKEE